MEFTVYNSNGQKKKMILSNIRVESIDLPRVDSYYCGMELKDTLICYGGGHKKPFLRFSDEDKNFVDVLLTDEIIEYIWEKIGKPKDGMLYGYTKDYRNNWCD